jgi:hypothetical protein
LHSSFPFLLAEPDGPNHAGDAFSFGRGKSDTLADTIAIQKDQQLMTAVVENPIASGND